MSMTMSNLVTTRPVQALIVITLFMLPWIIPDQAQAGCCQIKFNDPDLKLTNQVPRADPASFAVVDITDLVAIFRCCPPGNDGNNEGCKPQQEQRFNQENVSLVNLDNDVCKGAKCTINEKDIVLFRDVADVLDANFCPGGEGGLDIVNVLVGNPPELVPEMVWPEVTFNATGVKCGGTDGLDCTCTSATTPACTIYFQGTYFFDLPFENFSFLPMRGLFEGTPTVICNTVDSDLNNNGSPCGNTFVF